MSTLKVIFLVVNGQTVHGSQLDIENKNSIQLRCTENHEAEPSEKERNIEETLAASEAKVNPTDVLVEVFPLQPITKTTDSIEGILEEVRSKRFRSFFRRKRD
jgi:hypothetical protein